MEKKSNEEMTKLLRISREVAKNPKLEEKLRVKCRWEKMSRTAVIREFGHPKDW